MSMALAVLPKLFQLLMVAKDKATKDKAAKAVLPYQRELLLQTQ